MLLSNIVKYQGLGLGRLNPPKAMFIKIFIVYLYFLIHFLSFPRLNFAQVASWLSSADSVGGFKVVQFEDISQTRSMRYKVLSA